MSQTMPLTFKPICVEKVWGDPAWKHSKTADRTIGELLLLDASRSVIDRSSWTYRRMSPLLDKMFNDAWVAWRPAIAGHGFGQATNDKMFPITVKELGIGTGLSVQVHPSMARPELLYSHCGKDECWIVLEAGEASQVRIGLQDWVTRRDAEHAAESAKVADLMMVYRPQPGDVYTIPTGTLHTASGPLRLLEISKAFDETLRLYDWGRELPGRPLQRQEALMRMNVESRPQQPGRNLTVHSRGGDMLQRFLDVLPGMAMCSLKVPDGQTYHLGQFRKQMMFWYVLSGQALLLADEGYQEFAAGDHVLIPADSDARGWYGCRDNFHAVLVSLLSSYF